MRIEFLKPRTLALSGFIGAENGDALIQAIVALGHDRPIALSFHDVTGIDAGGIDVLHAVAQKAHQMGVVLMLLVPATGVLESLRVGGFDESPQILLEVLDTCALPKRDLRPGRFCERTPAVVFVAQRVGEHVRCHLPL